MNGTGGPSEARRAKEGASADFAEEMKGTTGLRPWRLHGRGEIDSAPRSCCGLREKTPDPFKFSIRLYLRGDICRFAQLSKHDTSQWDERAGVSLGGGSHRSKPRLSEDKWVGRNRAVAVL